MLICPRLVVCNRFSDCCALQQESENFLKDSLRAEAGARRARMRQRIAVRSAERVKELKAQRRSKDEINAEIAAIRAAGEAEENRLEAVSVVLCALSNRLVRSVLKM